MVILIKCIKTLDKTLYFLSSATIPQHTNSGTIELDELTLHLENVTAGPLNHSTVHVATRPNQQIPG